ncbi:MAG: N-acetylglucosamine-6-phosphate deacetylase [Lentisphaerae bacterium]|nr:N-acetylglucosamine-6-phosphate deacetylase [Lentisphaerota bacterium]
MSTTLIKNAHIISPDCDLANAAVLIADGVIKQIFADGDKLPAADTTVDIAGKMLVPGFIDVHTHGRSGYEFTDGDYEHLQTMCKDKLSEGVTSWLPTTLTLGNEALAKALENAARYAGSDSVGAKIPGVHLEGPYINEKCLGAQNPAYVRKPDIEEVKALDSIHKVLKVSYAVEVEGGSTFASELLAAGITPSCVHSQATYKEFLAGYDHGLRNLSHFCNQMTALHHRDIGLVGAGLRHSEVFIEMICDKIHLCSDMIKLIFQLKDINHILLITDACQAAGMPDGEYEIGGLPLILKDGAARLASNGALAGSVLVMNKALKNVYEITGLPLAQLIKTTSYNQACSLGLSKLGRIEPGYCADLAVLDSDFEVCQVWVNGRQSR